MENFKSIETAISELNQESEKKRQSLKELALDLMRKKMENREDLKKIIGEVEASTELTSLPHDEWYSQWIRVDFSEFIDIDSELEKEVLSEYLEEFGGYRPDFENDCLTCSIGPAILINKDGDILDQDSGKWIISRKEYLDDDGAEDRKKRNQLIESYMEKSGYFPSVIRVDHCGSAYYVSTQEKGE